jgi:transposase
MEPRGPARTAGVASSFLCQRATSGTADFVSSLAGIDRGTRQRSLRRGAAASSGAALLTHPGVGPITALATEVFLGNPMRFSDGKALASYIGMIPSEHSSGGRQRLGAMSKQGNTLLRYLWCEAAMHAVERDPKLKRFYRRKLVQKGLGKARVAAARKLGIRLWITLRDQIDYQEFCRRGKARQESGCVRAGMPDLNSGPAEA